MIDSPEDQNDSILLHIVLVGFNHRKGGEVVSKENKIHTEISFNLLFFYLCLILGIFLSKYWRK